MKNFNFDQRILGNIELPLKKLMELNVKTIQSMSYMKPVDLLSMKKPEDALERNMNIFVQNGHMALDYMKDVFSILEHHWLDTTHRTEDNARNMMRETASTVEQNVRESVASAKRAVKKVVSGVKVSARPSVKAKAKSAVKAVVKSAVKASAKPAVKASAKPAVKASAKPAVKASAKPAVKASAKPAVKASAKPAVKASAKPAVKASAKPAVKASAKPAVKASAKPAVKASSPRVVVHSKPHAANSMQHEVRAFSEKSKQNVHAKDVGHNMPKVSGMADKSGIKDLGIHVNKGPGFPN
ncbi:MAG: hypothetical protein P4L65_04530 [Legionella sp.]|nr:hypothetical protein [Legionella sp.]